MKPTIEIDPRSGFCFGVVYAIETAENYLKHHDQLYCLGDIIHNDEEVARLKSLGLKVIDKETFRTLKDATVLIRAHGEPPETYILARQNRIRLLDASCPIVLKLQHRIQQVDFPENQILLLGMPTHPEVIGLKGQVHNATLYVVSSLEEVQNLHLDTQRPVLLFSQTTKPSSLFHTIATYLQETHPHVRIYDTLCRQVSNREKQLYDFAAQQDVVIFTAGKKSSNGKALFQVCQKANPRAYYISDPEEIQWVWLEGAQKIGISGATSTPKWLIQKVASHIESLYAQVS
ncbi:MAG: 4-hydroxy-3-methylbut-2-enyl diphosphate reductase [Bacteroidia bacterium]